ncbi:hypothetical protein DL764_004087 [Monosporascus ibericus]|uniref:Glucose-methanol-choline oxidoreductase N-terminal domain-containing protein n=1 Tax=Monosporascus ibericus TaxID=155417 RepID=A0A4Q4TFV7_9PEZI|nr:hypothetical protein DL764_004087 [Monosporascus ibericus]
MNRPNPMTMWSRVAVLEAWLLETGCRRILSTHIWDVFVGHVCSQCAIETVLVIEAGLVDAGEKEIMIPRYYVASGGTYAGEKFNWNASTTPQDALGGRQIIFTQGKLIGWSSALNAIVYDRGRPSDYGSWPALNNYAKRKTVKVSKEAILSAGALRSPHLLMLSGIGEKAQLERHGIKTVVNIPGVDQNCQDHAIGSFAMRVDQSLEKASELEDPEFDALQGEEYYESRTGRWTDGLPASLAFIPYLNFTSDPDTVLDTVNHIIDMHRARSTAGQELMYLNGGQLFVTVFMHPLSRGTVKLASAEPFGYPFVDPQYLSHPSDIKLYVDALKYYRRIIATGAMKKSNAKEIFLVQT